MRVSDEEMDVPRPFFQHGESSFTQARASIKEDAVLACAKLEAGRVSAVLCVPAA
jgi:hypothetical protein